MDKSRDKNQAKGDRRISPALLNKLKKFNLHQKENIDIISKLHVWTSSDLAKLPLERLVHSGMKVVHARKIKAIVLGGDADVTDSAGMSDSSRNNTPNGTRLHSANQLEHDEIVKRTNSHIEAKRKSKIMSKRGSNSVNDVRGGAVVDLGRSQSLDNTAGTHRNSRISNGSLPGSTSGQSWTEKAQEIHKQGTAASQPRITTAASPHKSNDPNAWWSPLEDRDELSPVNEANQDHEGQDLQEDDGDYDSEDGGTYGEDDGEKEDVVTDMPSDSRQASFSSQKSKEHTFKNVANVARPAENPSKIKQQDSVASTDPQMLAGMPPPPIYDNRNSMIQQQQYDSRGSINQFDNRGSTNQYSNRGSVAQFDSRGSMVSGVGSTRLSQQPPASKYRSAPPPVPQARMRVGSTVSQGIMPPPSQAGGSFYMPPEQAAPMQPQQQYYPPPPPAYYPPPQQQGYYPQQQPMMPQGYGYPPQQPQFDSRGSAVMYDNRASAVMYNNRGSTAIYQPAQAGGGENFTVGQHGQGGVIGVNPNGNEGRGGFDGRGGSADLVSVGRLVAMGKALKSKGLLDESLTAFQKATKLLDELVGREHPDTALCLYHQAHVLRRIGKLEGAKNLYKEALAIQARTLGDTTTACANTVNDLAIVLQGLGELGAALSAFMEALRIKEAIRGADHPDFAMALNNVATMLQTLNRLDEALVYYEKSLKIKENCLGPEHQSVADTLFNIGAVKKRLGDIEGASECFLKSAAVSSRSLGPDHAYTKGAIEQLNALKVDRD